MLVCSSNAVCTQSAVLIFGWMLLEGWERVGHCGWSGEHCLKFDIYSGFSI